MVLGVFSLWYLGGALTALPDYLAYRNELVGGSENGYQWFADSSYDWGQDLKGLGQYVREHHLSEINLAYYGKAIPEYYGIHYLPFNAPEGCRPTNGVIAISTTKLQGVYEQDPAYYLWLQSYQPAAKIGYTIFLYHIP